jgi:hypothetical protein
MASLNFLAASPEWISLSPGAIVSLPVSLSPFSDR